MERWQGGGSRAQGGCVSCLSKNNYTADAQPPQDGMGSRPSGPTRWQGDLVQANLFCPGKLIRRLLN